MKNTLCSMFKKTVETYEIRPAFTTRSGEGSETVTYGELYNKVRALGTAIINRGVKHQDAVGLISDNRLEWIICDLACLMAGAADVPRGSDSTADEISYILKHSDSVAVFLENEAQLDKLMSVEGLGDNFLFLAVMDASFPGSDNPKVTTVAELIEEGEKLVAGGDGFLEARAEAVEADDLATIIYTSGTTGEPKGVMLTHRNIMQNVRVVPPLLSVKAEDLFLSILPPWHSFERAAEYVAIASGAATTYTSIKTLGQDMIREKPTYIASVPRIWEGIYFRVMSTMAKEKPIKQKIFNLLLSISKKYVKASRIMTREDAVFQPESFPAKVVKYLSAMVTLVLLFLPNLFAQKRFAAIRARTGGALRAAVSGGGALPAYVDEFFAAVGLTVLEGYGLTETSPVVAARLFDRRVMGTVGPMIPETEVKIVGEGGETLPQGEKGLIKLRGEQVMKGYYKREDLTNEVIDDEAWFDSGDLGRLTVRGELSITGRAKDTIVLLGGENIEPTPIEEKISESKFISQVMVVGQDKRVLGALVVPDGETIREHFQGQDRPLPDEPLSGQKDVQDLIRSEISRLVNKNTGFKPHELISKINILDREFKVGEELTHTLKMRRNIISDKYQRNIEELFS
jgi:long-chain acyl-CoA synthetase